MRQIRMRARQCHTRTVGARYIRPPARIWERPLNPPILGDFELRSPQNWGLGGEISG